MAERDALETAVRALRARDRSRAELADCLERRGVGQRERAEVLERLERAGYVDDASLARRRAAELAGRGAGDALIRDDLERRGVERELVEEAICALEPEVERAAVVVARRGRSAKTARYLASRGFGQDALTALVAQEE